ncbi:MAG: GxxExxY protein [Desulfobacteraceae bacterium]|nr:GxxExxY protein [Desulfobacteraceae bacterium]
MGFRSYTTYRINRAIFEASRALGSGFLEIELKCVESLSKLHESQILNYLKATGIQVGLLFNFKYPKAEIKRMVLGLKGINHLRSSACVCGKVKSSPDKYQKKIIKE